MLYTLIWKFALIAYTRADTDGEPFDQAIILRSAVRRLSTRLVVVFFFFHMYVPFGSDPA